MAEYIILKEEKVADAIGALKELEAELEELEEFTEQEEGGCGSAYEKMEEIHQEMEQIPRKLKKLVGATVCFLEEAGRAIKAADGQENGR